MKTQKIHEEYIFTEDDPTPDLPFDNTLKIILHIDFKNETYSIYSAKNDRTLFQFTQRHIHNADMNITILIMMEEAIKFAKKILEQYQLENT